MFEPQPYRDIGELSRLPDDELDAMANRGELSFSDLAAAKFRKSLDSESAPAPVQADNNGWDGYTTSVLKQLFPEA